MSEQTGFEEESDIDPNHPAVYQRGFAGRVIPPVEPMSRRARRAKEPIEFAVPLPAAEAGRPADGVEPTPTLESLESTGAPEPATSAPIRTRGLWMLTALAAALLLVGLGAQWAGSTTNYRQWATGANPSVDDAITASLLSTAGTPLITVGLAGFAVVLVVLSARARR